MKKILFLPLYNEGWASSIYRAYKHIPLLENLDLQCTVLRPPQPAFLPRLRYYSRLFRGCLTHHEVVIQKKIFRQPLFCLIRLTSKRVLFDFDDAIYCYENDLKEIRYILSKVDHILVADESLAAYARNHNRHVTVLPTPLEAGPVDMFLHDSDHSYDFMMFEFRTVWPFLKQGGLFLAHDVGRNDALFDFCREQYDRKRLTRQLFTQ